ncbi:HAMP domain-containing protein [bacterium]|nr:HAMP domain-containing protein [bacterium]
MNSNKKISFTTQNRLIIFGLVISTLMIMAIAIFATFNIQKNLDDSYQDFGQVISKVLAIESVEMTKDVSQDQALKILKSHTNSILKSHQEIVFIEFRDSNGELIYKANNKKLSHSTKPSISVSSPMTNAIDDSNMGSVVVGLSGAITDKVSKTTRASILFVFVIVWLVFAFVILINTYLITRELRILHDGVSKISSGEFGYKIEGKDVSEEVQELFNAFNDMSARLNTYDEQNVEQLTLERNKLEAVLMSIVNGVVVCDNNDNVVLLNNHAKELLELEGDQLLNTNIQQYVDTEGDYCFSEKIDEYKKLSLEEKSKKSIIFNVNIGGRILKSIISPMFTKNHDYVGYIIVLIDVTRETEMDQMKSQFISNVSHELRTPVTVLRSYIDTLYNYGNEFDFDTQKEFIGTINNEIIRLNRMVNDILDFSRLDSNAKVDKNENDLSQLVDACVGQIQVLLKEHNLNIDVQKENDIPLIKFNYDLIFRALTNYLSNAIKYAPQNSTITVKLYKELDKNQLTVTVRDEGIGIAPEFQKKVFDRFYRVENDTHTVKGTGLGLHLVKTTIEKHHKGNVFVNSQPNHGSTFGFSLPIDLTLVDSNDNELV